MHGEVPVPEADLIGTGSSTETIKILRGKSEDSLLTGDTWHSLFLGGYMEIKLIHGKNYDEQATLEIEVNGTRKVYAYPGEPEDFSLGRDLNFVYDIVPLMKEAWGAGKAGEKFVVHEEEE